MKILYVGDNRSHTNSFLRAQSLQRLGHDVAMVTPVADLTPELRHPIIGRIHYKTGYSFLQRKIVLSLREHLRHISDKFEIAWVCGGEWLGPEAIRELREHVNRVVLYHTDDLPGGRDGGRWRSLKRALPEYDLIAAVREVNVAEFLQMGARNVHRVMMSYDEIAHAPLGDGESVPAEFRSEVAFIGTWMPERGPLLAKLAESDVPLTIRGSRWSRCREIRSLLEVKVSAPVTERDYVKALTGTKVSLGLLSAGNRDLHTRRSVEIPYAGGVLCAQRTSEHLAMYREDEEAVFWSDAEECAEQCRRLLRDDTFRESVRVAGMRRVRELSVGNEDVCKDILNATL